MIVHTNRTFTIIAITMQVENTLVQMLAGCLHVLRREGCSLVGGHTSEGTECAMGLSVSGIAHPDRVFHKGLKGSKKSIEMLVEGQNPNKIDTLSTTGSNHSHSHTDSTVAEFLNTDIPDSMKNLLGESEFNSSSSNDSSSSSSSSSSSNGHLGHVLVLTKALGTGTIMAAHMRAKVTVSIIRTKTMSTAYFIIVLFTSIEICVKNAFHSFIYFIYKSEICSPWIYFILYNLIAICMRAASFDSI